MCMDLSFWGPPPPHGLVWPRNSINECSGWNSNTSVRRGRFFSVNYTQRHRGSRHGIPFTTYRHRAPSVTSNLYASCENADDMHYSTALVPSVEAEYARSTVHETGGPAEMSCFLRTGPCAGVRACLPHFRHSLNVQFPQLCWKKHWQSQTFEVLDRLERVLVAPGILLRVAKGGARVSRPPFKTNAVYCWETTQRD